MSRILCGDKHLPLRRSAGTAWFSQSNRNFTLRLHASAGRILSQNENKKVVTENYSCREILVTVSVKNFFIFEILRGIHEQNAKHSFWFIFSARTQLKGWQKLLSSAASNQEQTETAPEDSGAVHKQRSSALSSCYVGPGEPPANRGGLPSSAPQAHFDANRAPPAPW